MRRALVAAGSLLAAGALVACGTAGPAGPGGAGGAAQVWALQDTVLNPIEQASIQRFNDGPSQGTAELATFGNDPYKQRLRVALGSPNAPDVFFNWGGGNLEEYVDAGAVEDLTPVLDQNPALKESFIPTVLEAAQIDGKYYGIPMRGVQPVALFYNKAVFGAAGVQPPTTYQELLALVDTFKARGVTPIALAGSQSWTELMWVEYLLDRVGGPETFEAIRNGDPGAWQQPAVLDALTRIKELVDRGAFGTDFASVGYDVGGASTILAQGNAAMHLMGSWEYVNQLGQSPDFVRNGDLGWVAFPAVEGGAGDPVNIVGNPTNFYSVAASSDAKPTAIEYVSTALNNEQYVQELINAGDVPAVTGVRDKLAAAENSDYTTFIYDLVEGAPNFQLSWDQDLPAEQVTKMLTELQRLFLGEQTPQGFVDTMSTSA